MNPVDLAFTSALEQARLIRTKEISPVELTQLYLDRIAQLDPQLGSFYTVTAEGAIADARSKAERLSEPELPPFFGVPIGIKDLNPVEGVPCSYGLKVARNQIAMQDDLVVTRLKQAGFIILGKTATSQLASFPYTEAPGFPPARNPWNLEYTPGGSSGGSSAAVAAGLCAIAQGSDGGGSVRGPAACCGLVGLKPSRGRISMAPIGEALGGFAVNGALAHTVADAAAFLDVTAGYVTGDPYWLPDPETSFLEATQRQLEPLRIGLVTEIEPIGKADSTCVQAVEKIAHLLEAMGHTIEPLTLDFGEMIEPFTLIWRTQTDVGVPPFLLEKVNRWLWWRAKFTSAGRYAKSRQQLQIFARKVVELCDRFDVLLTPTYMYPTIRVGEWAKLSPASTIDQIIRWIAPCPAFNVTGQPGISIPAGFDSNGVPIGVQLVGRPADEATILALAAQIEQVQPWIGIRPAMAQT
ncbi:amidase [Leptolyngbya sp. FACHB-17]|uniref:amidase n=1 Tax=unclassified Leptolyngbya TaxID=2650499 RepID=UPI0016803D76|nr:amidase [Leptolyngbya sp. FACHB-17]MBD2079603.1 amidase [Leptolyngbya sp. FACHB-17]